MRLSSLRSLVVLGGALAFVTLSSLESVAEDSDRLRYYLHLRGQDTNPWTGVHDHWGLSLGANLGRYWGVELSVDTYERFVEFGGRTVGEYGVGAIVPQLRLRYPLFDDRLVPYVVAGVGVGLAQFNDRKPPAYGIPIKDTESVFPVATLGGGLEYYFADNLALGAEVKYVAASEQTLDINRTRREQAVDGILTTLGLRLLFPELHPPTPPEPGDAVPLRLYVGLRYGGGFTETDAFSGGEVRPEPAAWFSAITQFFGGAVGLNIGRYLGVEMAAEGYEARLHIAGVGNTSELGVGFFIPHARFRYPITGGRLVPYALGGVGLSTVKTNDTKSPGKIVDVDVAGYGMGAALGAGVEYFVTSNIATGLEARYLTARGHTARVNGGPERDAHYDVVAVTLTLRVFLATFGR
jgi:opacity protein-like surface antigen